jgi:hypothetical protein
LRIGRASPWCFIYLFSAVAAQKSTAPVLVSFVALCIAKDQLRVARVFAAAQVPYFI